MKDHHPPAFLFYPSDFASDGHVEAMTTEEVGCYILLLCKAWYEHPVGSIPDDDRTLARWTRLTPERWSECKPAVLSAFTLGTDSRYHQKRLRAEYAKLRHVHQSRFQAGKKGAKSRWCKSNDSNGLHSNAMRELWQTDSKHIAKEDENEIEDMNIQESEEKKPEMETLFDVAPIDGTVVSPIERRVGEVSASIKSRHPALRSASEKRIADLLKQCIRRVSVHERIAMLDTIDEIHALWCATDGWIQDDGQYAKSIENYLAPTKERYLQRPPQSAMMPRLKPMRSTMDRVAQIYLGAKRNETDTDAECGA